MENAIGSMVPHRVGERGREGRFLSSFNNLNHLALLLKALAKRKRELWLAVETETLREILQPAR